MKVTLDHNCLIDLEKQTVAGSAVSDVVSDPQNQCYIVNIGASELLQKGIKPDRYDLFERFLSSIGLSSLPRLNPMMLFDITFWGHFILADDAMVDVSEKIKEILFHGDIPPRSLNEKKAINRLCDIHTLWCHVHYGNEVFLTSDGNFMKESKLPKLINLGAGQICHPSAFKA